MHAGIPHCGRCCIQRRRPSVSDSRDSLSAASNNVGGCGAVWSGRGTATGGWMANIAQDRQKRGTHWTGEAAGGWRGIGAMDDIPRMARVQPITAPLLALNHMCHPATTTITSQPRLAEGRRPPAPAAGRGGQRRFCPSALAEGCSVWRSLPWGPSCIPAACLATGSPSHTHFTPSDQCPPSQDLPETPLRSPHHQQPATPTPSLRCVSTAAIYPALASTRLRAGRLPLIVSVFPFASQSQCVSAGRIP